MQCETAVRPAVAGDVGELSALLAEAFVSNPVASWLIGDVAARYTTFLRVFEVELTQALSHGIVRVAGDGAGVAVWQPYPMVLETVTAHDRALLGAVGIYRRRFAHLRATRDEHRSAALRLPTGPDRPERPDQRAEAAVAAAARARAARWSGTSWCGGRLRRGCGGGGSAPRCSPTISVGWTPPGSSGTRSPTSRTCGTCWPVTAGGRPVPGTCLPPGRRCGRCAVSPVRSDGGTGDEGRRCRRRAVADR
ncbi:hypothetical protein O7608_19830 [Solwaraspora sp. WMMA2056]|uniref:hypothetical protein n=1 Tax=Solwaraspora sp. WMMA2056 TaxID=3015161 RepID=UPI00259B4100|nr:hypothetical protein [Solwaraspora sp. WMMA2056]WJK38743.1 hypothetical protein O7608_19830 [Solwaraspora sp. WMMA2056]